MAGMKIVTVSTDKDGNVNIPELKEKAEQHSKNLAALMITYPSTHGEDLEFCTIYLFNIFDNHDAGDVLVMCCSLHCLHVKFLGDFARYSVSKPRLLCRCV
jgi:hypothetical protein